MTRAYNGVSLNDFGWDFGKMAAYALTNTSNDAFIVRRQIGQNVDVDAAADEDVWSAGGTLVIPTAASVITIVSSSVNDAAAGTGARTLTVYGLDASYLPISETVTLNGTTNVLTVASFLRVNYAVVVTAGSGLTNAGAITFTVDSKNQATMAAGDAVTHNSHYTVPAGYTAFILGYAVTAARGSATGLPSYVISKLVTVNTSGIVFKHDYQAANDLGAGFVSLARIPMSVAEKTLIKIIADSETDNTIVDSEMDLLLIKNSLLG